MPMPTISGPGLSDDSVETIRVNRVPSGSVKRRVSDTRRSTWTGQGA